MAWFLAQAIVGAALPELVKDLAETRRDWASGPYVRVGNFAYLIGHEVATGAELWKSDGTPEGTTLVKDLSPGAASTGLSGFTAVGDTLFFVGHASGNGVELWRSDGTASGTEAVKNIYPAGNALPSRLTPWGNRVAFTARDGIHGTELWVSDGTEEGTTMVADLSPDGASTVFERMVPAGDRMIFVATVDGQLTKTWITDGTEAGTGIFAEGRIKNASNLHETGGEVHFTAYDLSQGQILLWRTDGTPEGTATISSTPVDFGSSTVAMGGQFYFLKSPNAGSSELWRTDGQGGPAEFIKAMGKSESLMASRAGPDANSFLYFRCVDAASGEEPWTSDGTAAGTNRLADINPGPGNSYPRDVTFVGDRVFFSADQGDSGKELWSSNGTPSDTYVVREFVTGISDLAELGNRLLLEADDGITGKEFWQSDGTAQGTTLVKDFRGTSDSSPQQLVVAGDRLFFTSLVPGTGRVLHVTDGTGEGTTASARLGFTETRVNGPQPLGDILLFNSENMDGDYELWRSDGTIPGQQQVKNIRADGSSSPANLMAMSGFLCFTADDGVHGRELWRTDGTGDGTTLVKDIVSGAAGSNPSAFTKAGDGLYFTVAAGATTELWTSDGNGAGTVIVRSFDSTVGNLTAVDDLLYFTGKDGAATTGLWRTDGTGLGTQRIFTLPSNLTTGIVGTTTYLGLDGDLFFLGRLAGGSIELWRSDGTTGETVRIATMAGNFSPYAPGLVLVSDGLLFCLADGADIEIWWSDGTSGGTQPIRRFADTGSIPEIAVSGDFAWFLAGNGEDDYDLWRTDGTPAGTSPAVIEMPWLWIYTTPLRIAGPNLYFPIESDPAGEELYKLPLAGLATVRGLYEVWAEGEGLDGDATEPELSPFGDGVENLLKYAFFMKGSGPDSSGLVPGTGTSGLPHFSCSAGPDGEWMLRVEFIRRKDSGLVYTPMFSTSLADGSFLPMTGEAVVSDIDQSRERVVVVQPAEGARCFGVVEVRGL